MRGEVDKTSVARELQNQIDVLKGQLEAEKEKHAEELQNFQEDYDKKINIEKKEKRRITTQALKTKDIKVSGVKAFDNFARSFNSADMNDMGVELKDVRQKLEQEEDKSEKMKKKYDREIAALTEQVRDLTVTAQRNEKKYQKYEEESKQNATQFEKETKLRWELEKEKVSNQRELRDTQKLLKDTQANVALIREEMLRLEQRSKAAVDASKEAISSQTKVERDLTLHRRINEEESERTKQTHERKVTNLEKELEEWRARTKKTEANESSLIIEKRKLQTEFDKIKSQLELQTGELEREKTKFERQLTNNTKQYTEEIERIKEEQRKAEEKRQKEAKFLEGLQKRTEEEIQSRKAIVAQTLEKVKAETEQLKDEKSKVRELTETGKLKEMMDFKEKQWEDEMNDLRKQLKERERSWQKEKEKMLDDEKEREREWNSERKKMAEREKKRNDELEKLNHEFIDEKHSKQSVDEGNRKLADDLRIAQNNLEDEIEERKIDNERNAARIKQLQEEINDIQVDNHELSSDLRKTETQLRDAEDELRKAKRESEDSKLLYDEVNSTLAKTQATLEKTIFEAKQKQEALQQQLSLAQNEANEERKEKERQTKLRSEAEKRVEELEWYFLPFGEQAKTTNVASPALKLMQKKKKEIVTELEDIKKRHQKKPESVEDLHQRLVDSLRNIPESNKEATAYQLQGLMQALEATDFPIRIRLKISVALVEGLVDPEIIREIRILTEIMVDDTLHFLDTPETVIRLALRDVEEQKARPDYIQIKRSEIITFRDALLSRLAKLRARRMRKPKAEVKEGILQELYTAQDYKK